MPIEGKYLKYNKSITFEIFEEIWNKLIKSGLKPHPNGVKAEYTNAFVKQGGFLMKNEKNAFGVYYSERDNKLETTVQEILGYDPFVKEVIADAVEPKQPLKQAVHCKTQEEWDFVKDKIVDKSTAMFKKEFQYGSAITYSNSWDNLGYLKDNNYQILSFQEWCDLNGYKVEKEVKFEVGKWYKLNNCWWAKFLNIHNSGKYFRWSEHISCDGEYYSSNSQIEFEKIKDSELASIEEIQKFLPDGHANKITPVIQQTRDMQKSNQEFKTGDFVIVTDEILKSSWVRRKESVGYVMQIPDKVNLTKFNNGIPDCEICSTNKFGINYKKDWIRHATPEEINNHLISIGQMPMGIQLGSTSDNAYNHLIDYGIKVHEEFFGECKTQLLPKMILSIDDEELPMVNIIKTKTVNLLNLE